MFKDNPVSRDYINGTAVHWYFDKLFPASLLTTLHNKYPNKFILSTEAATGKNLKLKKRTLNTRSLYNIRDSWTEIIIAISVSLIVHYHWSREGLFLVTKW